VSSDERRKGEAALAASARAFRKAQNCGLVWLSDDGAFHTHESFDMPEYKAPANPDQLPLTH
jgi:hypothetical protein